MKLTKSQCKSILAKGAPPKYKLKSRFQEIRYYNIKGYDKKGKLISVGAPGCGFLAPNSDWHKYNLARWCLIYRDNLPSLYYVESAYRFSHSRNREFNDNNKYAPDW